MKRIFKRIGPLGLLAIAGGLLAGCANYGSVGGVTDGRPAHEPAATEPEALARCAQFKEADRQAECVAMVKQRFHDTSK